MQNELKEKKIVTKDLTKIFILVTIFCLLLVGLKIVDNQTGYITKIAEKISSIVIK